MKRLRIAPLPVAVLAVALPAPANAGRIKRCVRRNPPGPGRAVRCTKRNGAVLVAFRYRLP